MSVILSVPVIYHFVYVHLPIISDLFIYIYVCIYPSISIHLYIYRSIYLSIYLFIYSSLSIYISIYLSIYLFIYSFLSIYISLYLSIYLSIYLGDLHQVGSRAWGHVPRESCFWPTVHLSCRHAVPVPPPSIPGRDIYSPQNHSLPSPPAFCSKILFLPLSKGKFIFVFILTLIDFISYPTFLIFPPFFLFRLIGKFYFTINILEYISLSGV